MEKLFYNKGIGYPRQLPVISITKRKLERPDVSQRLLRIAKKHGYRTIKQLLGLKTVTAQKWYGFGDKTIEELLKWKLEKREELKIISNI